MDKLLQMLVDLLPQLEGPWKYAVPIAALLVVVAPKVADLFREVVDFRLGRRRLEIEKLHLEVLKLRMELGPHAATEPRAATSSAIPQFRSESKEATVPAPSEPAPQSIVLEGVEAGNEGPGWVRKWVSRFPRFTRVILFLSQILLAYLAFSFGLVVLAFPFIAWQEGVDSTGMVFAVLVYGGLTWLSYKGFARIRMARKAIQFA